MYKRGEAWSGEMVWGMTEVTYKQVLVCTSGTTPGHSPRLPSPLADVSGIPWLNPNILPVNVSSNTTDTFRIASFQTDSLYKVPLFGILYQMYKKI